jgi:hypothetical protein
MLLGENQLPLGRRRSDVFGGAGSRIAL